MPNKPRNHTSSGEAITATFAAGCAWVAGRFYLLADYPGPLIFIIDKRGAILREAQGPVQFGDHFSGLFPALGNSLKFYSIATNSHADTPRIVELTLGGQLSQPSHGAARPDSARPEEEVRE